MNNGSFWWAHVAIGLVSAVQSATAQPCATDVNGDGRTDGTDLSVLLAQWGACASGSSCAGDINNDGEVSGADLTSLLAGWGPCVAVPSWATLLEPFPDPEVVHDASLRESIIATGQAWRVRDTTTQIEMVLIPPGTYQRGCSPSAQAWPCFDHEYPIHHVTLTQSFYLGRYEVTQAQWQSQMGSNPSLHTSASSEVPASQVPNRPVERVSWSTIQGFLIATGMRLPTDAEWEWAYRAGTTTAFHSMPGSLLGTNDDALVVNIAWIGANSPNQTRPVGQLAGNGFGLHDMSGNVWEWVNDWLSFYSSSSQTDPTGPATGVFRVVRGGAWGASTAVVRASYRGNGVPEYAYEFGGFRVARNP